MGVGLVAAVDELVFHQILGWHHFYDASTPAVGLMSDGFLHAGELLALVAGFFLLGRLLRRGELSPGHGWAGLLIGVGGFQLLDGLVNHKVLRLHQIRYGVELLPYDLAWNVGALLFLGAGLVLLRRARRAEAESARAGA